MSNSSWKKSLNQALLTSPDSGASIEPVRLAIMGVGNELNGDDAAGVAVVRALNEALAGQPRLLLIEAGLAPENFTGPLRRFAPNLVLIVDAANMGDEPGSVRWVDWQDTDGLSASTHSLPPSVLATYLIHELGCQVALLGIQAQQVEFGEPVSTPVQRAVVEVVDGLTEILGNKA
jgi:hydrogenase 3 maturation protease